MRLREILPVKKRYQSKTWCLTVDVEEWYQVGAFEGVIDRHSGSFESRIEEQIALLLALFERKKTQVSFFVLGGLAQKHPALIRKMAAAGHEIACHGMDHDRVPSLGEKGFLADIIKAKSLLEDITGQAVIGYRAPNFSFSKETPWAYKALAQAGFLYSSSVYPVARDHYGDANAPAQPYFVHSDQNGISHYEIAQSNTEEAAREGKGALNERAWANGARPFLEIPMSRLVCLGRAIPASGGGFFRLLPYGVSRWLLEKSVSHRQKNDAEDIGITKTGHAIFYMHPWEIDPQQPRIKGLSLKNHLRHYTGQRGAYKKLARLLDDFSWARMDETIAYPLLKAGAYGHDRQRDKDPKATAMPLEQEG